MKVDDDKMLITMVCPLYNMQIKSPLFGTSTFLYYFETTKIVIVSINVVKMSSIHLLVVIILIAPLIIIVQTSFMQFHIYRYIYTYIKCKGKKDMCNSQLNPFEQFHLNKFIDSSIYSNLLCDLSVCKPYHLKIWLYL